MSSPEVSFVDIDLAIEVAKGMGGGATLSGYLRQEVAVILPGGDTTLYDHFDRFTQTAVENPGMQYLGLMRREGLRKRFTDPHPDLITEGGRLVLVNFDGLQSVRPKIIAVSNSMTQVDTMFNMS